MAATAPSVRLSQMSRAAVVVSLIEMCSSTMRCDSLCSSGWLSAAARPDGLGSFQPAEPRPKLFALRFSFGRLVHIAAQRSPSPRSQTERSRAVQRNVSSVRRKHSIQQPRIDSSLTNQPRADAHRRTACPSPSLVTGASAPSCLRRCPCVSVIANAALSPRPARVESQLSGAPRA